MALAFGYRLRGPQGGNKGEVPQGRPFKYQGVDYPADWIDRGGALPGVASIEAFDNRPPPPGPPSVWRVSLSTIFGRLNPAQLGALATSLDGRPAADRWELIAEQSVLSDDGGFRALIASLPGSPDPDVVLAR